MSLKKYISNLPLIFFFLIFSHIAFAQLADDFQNSIRARVDGGHNASIVVGTIDESGTRFFSYGKTAFKDGKPVDQNTIYEIGSISKVFTSLVLAEMVEEGDIHLDDPIKRHLPKGTVVPSFEGKEITVRHLATHASGLPYMPNNIDMTSNPDNPFLTYGEKELLDFLNTFKLTRTPGEKYEYSNYAVGLLGYILASKNKMTYEEMMKRFICEKWNMPNTILTFNEEQKGKSAIGHSGKIVTSNWDFDALAGAGAIRSNVNDMLEFLAYQMGLKETDMQNAVEMSQQLYFTEGGGVALGWHFFKDEYIWHNGGTGGYRSFTGFDPDKKRGIVIFTNSGDGVDDLGFHWLDGEFPLKEVKKLYPVTSKDLSEYVGEYNLMNVITFMVTAQDDQLMIQLTGQGKNSVFPSEKDKFFYKVVDAQITFKRDEAGKVNALILHQNGMDQEAKRVK